jgi:heme/copper-type cytochrome/quinol oxidase subunit 4
MSDPRKQRNDYIHYSSAGIQMVLTILLFTYLGTRADKYFETDKPIWTAILAIFGVVIAIIFMLKAFLPPTKKKPKDKEEDEKKAE